MKKIPLTEQFIIGCMLLIDDAKSFQKNVSRIIEISEGKLNKKVVETEIINCFKNKTPIELSASLLFSVSK